MRRISLSIAITMVFTLNSRAATLYVWQNSQASAPPFLSWATAAHTIQDAVDAANAGDTVLVTNGVYSTGGKAVSGSLTNRVAATKPIKIVSINGPESAIIQGNCPMGVGAVRCAYLSDGSVLSGFGLSNGATHALGELFADQAGAGVFCNSTAAVVTNCVLAGNMAFACGGGSYSGTLHSCRVVGNSAGSSASCGGGVSSGTLYNCTIVNNNAVHGGGAFSCLASNCMFAENNAIDGGGASLGMLIHCTLTDNFADEGGGASSNTLSFCTVCSNTAQGVGGGTYWSNLKNSLILSNWAAGPFGGGACYGELVDCVAMGNEAYIAGGGAAFCSLNNCTVVGNGAASFASGAYRCVVKNCILYYNQGPDDNWGADCFVTNSCIPDLSGNGSTIGIVGPGNFTNAPVFLDVGGGDYHLQANSPCINSGNNAFATNQFDLDGNPRTVSGAVDMGAYEYQAVGSAISYAWLQQYGLPTDGSADLLDADGDSMNNWQEWIADTVPTDATSELQLNIVSVRPQVTIQFASSTNRLYSLVRCGTLAGLTAGSCQPVSGQTDISGNGGSLTLTDATPPAIAFYRVSVRLP